MDSITKYSRREITTIIFLLILISLTISQTWSEKEKSKNEANLPYRYSLQMSLFNWVAKISVGAREISISQTKDTKDISKYKWLKNGDFIKGFLNSEDKDFKTEQIQIAKLILASELMLSTEYEQLLEKYSSNLSSSGHNITALINQVYWNKLPAPESHIKQNATEYLTENTDKIIADMGWIGSLFISKTRLYSDPNSTEQVRNKLLLEAKHRTLFFSMLLAIAAIFLFFGGILFLVFIFKAFSGTLKLNFNTSKIRSILILETFVLYLFCMNLIFLTSKLSFPSINQQLYLTGFGTLSLILLISWPKFFGESFSKIRQTTGLEFISPIKFIKNVLLAPTFVAACWPIFILIIFIYQILLNFFNVNISSAEHPVVPIFIASNSNTVIFLLFLFAVIIAPIVEEIMFRGVLYSWLRTKLGALNSIMISALIFASVHPQGAVGIIPLMLIGCILGFLREWRGNLVACVIAHATVNGAVLSIILQLR